MVKLTSIAIMALTMMACTAKSAGSDAAQADSSAIVGIEADVPAFSADSAYAYLKRQVDFGPRVPNSESHRITREWLASELKRHGAEVTEQPFDQTAFDGTLIHGVNIFGSFNAGSENRILLLAHYDTRPWADKDADPANHSTPVPGANDGASGVGVLLEAARIIGNNNPGYGVDILFVDAEDYGDYEDEDSWALGARYFAQHKIKPGYAPNHAILLDMVGDSKAVFPAEYFSREAAPEIDDAFRRAADVKGYAEMFPRKYGSGVTDDHVELINAGIPAIDIIDYRPDTGFPPSWHTLNDNLDNISTATLKAVGETLIHYLYTNQFRQKR